MILFLDFDGVLHPSPTDARGHLCHLGRFERVMRQHDLSVVISSSWREVYPFDDVILELFSPDLRPRILATTPIIKDSPREDEISAWVTGNGYGGPFLALDDQVDEFPSRPPWLLLCDPQRGFDEKMERKLQEALARFENNDLAEIVRKRRSGKAVKVLFDDL